MKACREEESPRKRQRGSCHPPEVAGRPAKATKRKAGTEAERSSRRKRGHNHATDPSSSPRGPSSSNGKSKFSILFGHKSRADFNEKYQMLYQLGEGGFGSVYAGQRRSDLLPVAIKCMPKRKVQIGTFVFDGKEHQIPLEVLIMMTAAGTAGLKGKSAVVQFKDWYDLGEEVFLVMERPIPCVDLFDHVEDNGGQLDEHRAKIIMKQLVEAAIDMHDRKMFHQDLKLENILIQTTSDGPRVRVIDFGCASYAKDGPYRGFTGTFQCAPPEVFLTQSFEAVPTTVWQMGALLFNMVNGGVQFDTCDFICSEMQLNNNLSEECRDLLSMCLASRPDKRATLEQIRQHPWLSCSCGEL
ncbi:unnamed protein product [Pleuronectes platessa]|uniref:non-specific serine/threonine protein kinase n=1 Tax=Pleuronectes platessa TaxID=8262 RepID=A0A9N7VD12_PLEPL|nr:unnamed protein product [Pleuronectes platessa]